MHVISAPSFFPSECHSLDPGTRLWKEGPLLRHIETSSNSGLQEGSLLNLAAYADKPGEDFWFFLPRKHCYVSHGANPEFY